MHKNKKNEKEYFVYILECSDKTLYTGITTNLERRVLEHNGKLGKNKGAKYTQYRRPVKMIFCEKKKNKSKALKREFEIKKLSKMEKENLIK